jgi:hypothetical protein
MSDRKPLQVRYVTLESRSGGLLAVCLEHCLMAHAQTHEELVSELYAVVVSHSRQAVKKGLEPILCLPPAPKKYQEMWDPKSASKTPTLLVRLPAEVSPTSPPVELTEGKVATR